MGCIEAIGARMTRYRKEPENLGIEKGNRINSKNTLLTRIYVENFSPTWVLKIGAMSVSCRANMRYMCITVLRRSLRIEPNKSNNGHFVS